MEVMGALVWRRFLPTGTGSKHIPTKEGDGDGSKMLYVDAELERRYRVTETTVHAGGSVMQAQAERGQIGAALNSAATWPGWPVALTFSGPHSLIHSVESSTGCLIIPSLLALIFTQNILEGATGQYLF